MNIATSSQAGTSRAANSEIGDYPDALVALEQRLASTAHDAGLTDAAYRTVDSPIGPLLIATTERGIVRIAFELEGFDSVVDELGGAIGGRILRNEHLLDEAARQFDGYFDASRTNFNLDVDWRLSSKFRLLVQQYLPRIAYGTTQSYAYVADAVGNPNATRAVGSACATNPVPILVPCHRVLRSDGTSGQYRGGPAAKKYLLALEHGDAFAL